MVRRKYSVELRQLTKMVLIKYFCFYFPVRLGVIITSVLACLQSLMSLVYCMINDTKHFKMIIDDMQENIEDYSSNQVFDKFLEIAEKCKIA